MIKNLSKNSITFYISVFAGLLIWVLVFIVLPVDTQSSISLNTIAFLIANYMAIIIGFSVFKFGQLPKYKIEFYKLDKVLAAILTLLFVSYILRYIDLLLIRDLSFSNTVYKNRWSSVDNAHNANLIFAFASVLKSLYFFPIIIYIASKSKNNLLLIGSILLILCRIPEAILMGTRKPFLEFILLFIISAIYFKSTKIKKLKIPAIIILTIALFIVSANMLFKRVDEYVKDNSATTYEAILDAKYNKFLTPNKKVTTYINDIDKPTLSKNSLIMAVHFGQYYTHGLFELNYLIENKSKSTYGAYTFSPFAKFTNKLGFTDIDLKKVSEASPRRIVYLTAFGGLFIDFKWFSVIVMFLLGVFQKYVSAKAEKSVIWKPLFFYLLIINVFLCVLNYVRGSGVYPIIGFFMILFLLKLFHSKLHEKSPST